MRTRLRPTVMGDLPKVTPSHNFVFAQKIHLRDMGTTKYTRVLDLGTVIAEIVTIVTPLGID